jgi:hypothetical protein
VTRRRRAAVRGLVGALFFLVLGQGYRLLVDVDAASLPALLAVGAAVGAASGAITYLAEPRLKRRD